MGFIRKMAVALCATLMGITLLGVAWTNIGASTIRNKKVVEDWFNKSGFYTQISDVAIDTIKKSTAAGEASSIPVTDPNVEAIVRNALNPDFLKTTVNSALDGVYGWLGSSSGDLSFKLDFSAAKDTLATGLGNFAKTHAASLPPCGVIGNNSPVEDPFTATCLPRGVTADQVGAMATQNFLAQDFLKNPVVDANSFKINDKDGNKVPITSDSKVMAVRKAYHLSGHLPLVLAIITVLLIIAIIFLSSTRLRGVRRVGTILLTTGGGLLAIYFIVRYLFDWASKRAIEANPENRAQIKLGVDFLKLAIGDAERVLLTYSVGFMILGIVAIVVAFLLKRRGNPKPGKTSSGEEKPEPVEEAETVEVPAGIDLTPVEPKPTAPEVPKHSRPPRKIQL